LATSASSKGFRVGGSYQMPSGQTRPSSTLLGLCERVAVGYTCEARSPSRKECATAAGGTP
jgi:hypothetical protein